VNHGAFIDSLRADRRSDSRTPPDVMQRPVQTGIAEGYFLCVAVFLIGAAVQAVMCRRGSATVTLGFLMLTFLILAMLWPWGIVG